MSSLLVTGGAGFIGSNFVRHVLATTDHTVTVLDALTYAEVARQLGVTGNRVRRAERRALERLREVCPQGERERLAG